MKGLTVILFFLFGVLNVYGQTKPVQGFVVDKDTKQRLAKVYIYNSSNDEAIFNNAKGEFLINAKVGDTIFAALQSYGADTVVYKGQNAIIFQLKSFVIRLKEVSVFGRPTTPQEQYTKTLREYKYALSKGSTKDLLNLGPTGVGLGIDAIYNLLSREGKNARHLQAILERDYHEAVIDFRFNPNYVKSVIGASDTELKDFMLQYRPTYLFTLTASDYSFVLFIRNSYASYKRNPGAFRLPKLPKIEIQDP